MRNRAEGPRRARVSVSSLGDNYGRVDLEEFDDNAGNARRAALRPRMRLGLFAIEADDEPELAERIHELSDMARASSARDIDTLARQWWQRHPNDPRLRFGKAVVADSVESLQRALDLASQEKSRARCPCHADSESAGVCLPGPGQPVRRDGACTFGPLA